MFQISLQVDDKYLQARMPKEVKRFVYNVAEALNKTMLMIQAEIVQEMTHEFVIRKASSGRTGAWITDQIVFNAAGRASAQKGKLFADLKLGGKDRVLLPLYETEGIRKPFVGKTNIASPVTSTTRAGGEWSGMVDPKFLYKALGLKLVPPPGVTNKVANAMRKKGIHRAGGDLYESKIAFTIFSEKHPLGAIYIRTGPDKKAIAPIYFYDPPYKLRHQLKAFDIAARIAGERFAIEMHIAYAGRPLGTEI